MKSHPIVALLATLGAVLALSSTTARAQTAPDWRYVNWTEARLNSRADVMSLMEQWAPFLKKHAPDTLPYEFYTGDDGKMYFADFLRDLNDIERGEKMFEKAIEKYMSMGLPDLGPKWFGGVASTDSSVWKLDPELSYMPEGTMAAMRSQPFRKLIVFHLKNDKVEAWKEVAKSLAAVDRKVGIITPRFVFEAKVGADLPAFSFVVPAQDVADYYAGLAKRNEKRGPEEGARFVKALQDTSRTVQNYNLTLQPTLSRPPTE